MNKHGFVFQNDYDSNDFHFLLSDDDILNASIDKNSLTINTLKQGFAYVYVQSLSYPHLFDVFEINVGKFIEPSGKIILHVGDEITFLNLHNRSFNEWKVSDDSLATITSTGKLTSKSEGIVEV